MARPSRSEALAQHLLQLLEADPRYPVEEFLHSHPREAPLLRERIARLRTAGLLDASAPAGSPIARLRGAPEAAAPDDELLPGGLLCGRYRCVSEIASGGMGRVLRAHDEELARSVALKIARNPSDASDAARCAAFGRLQLEARVTGGLEHPGIPSVHGVGSLPDGRPFFAMKLVEGESLLAWIRRLERGEPRARRELPLARRIRIVQAICDAVGYAHERGVVHRDLKPSNVMVGRFGEVQVMDWGLAKLLVPGVGEAPGAADEQPSSEGWSRTLRGQVFGTPSYMAPEQARGESERVGPRTDVFGIGAILLHLVAGRPPYSGRSVDEVLERAKTGALNDPAFRRRPRPPRELAAVCRKAMAPELDSRYASPAELAADLDAFLARRRGRAWRDPPHARLLKLVARRPAAATATAALLFVAVIGWAGWQAHERQRELEYADRHRKLVEQIFRVESRAAAHPIERRTASFVADIREYIGILRSFGVDMAADRPVAQQAASLRGLGRGNGELRAAALDGIYALSKALELSGFTDSANWGERGGPEDLGQIARKLQQGWPELIALATRVRELVPLVEEDPWRLEVWRAWRAWFDGGWTEGPSRELQALLSRDAIGTHTGADLGWAAYFAKQALGREEGAAHSAWLHREALRDDPARFWSHMQLGQHLFRPFLGHESWGSLAGPQLTEALACFTAAIALQPQAVGALSNRGLVHEAMGWSEAAEADYRRAVELEPRLVSAWSNLGSLLLDEGRLGESEDALARAVAIDPEDPDLHANLAAVYEELHLREPTGPWLERAVERLRRALELQPTRAPARLRLARALADQENLQDAHEEAHGVLDGPGGDGAADEARGLLLDLHSVLGPCARELPPLGGK